MSLLRVQLEPHQLELAMDLSVGRGWEDLNLSASGRKRGASNASARRSEEAERTTCEEEEDTRKEKKQEA